MTHSIESKNSYYAMYKHHYRNLNDGLRINFENKEWHKSKAKIRKYDSNVFYCHIKRQLQTMQFAIVKAEKSNTILCENVDVP